MKLAVYCPICNSDLCSGSHPYIPLAPTQAITFSEHLFSLLQLRQSDTLNDLMKLGDFAALPFEDWIRTYQSVLNLLRRAQVVLWRSDLWTAAITGADEIFCGTMIDPEVFTPPVQLWIPDRDFFYSDVHAAIMRVEPRANMVAVIIYRTEDAVYYAPIIGPPISDNMLRNMPENERDALLLEKMYFRIRPVKISIKDPVPEGAGNIAEIVALATFMNQPVAEIKTMGLARAERRRRERTGEKCPTIRVVMLRHVQHAKTTAGETVDWKYQWIVSGHWRKQWHPSTQTHTPMFISSYIKGPEGKPLKAPSKSIYVVQR
jgi:hypothetical protein